MSDNSTNDRTLFPGITEKITAILSDKVMFALLFGSSVTGRLTPESDIDIGAWFLNHQIDFEKIITVQNALSDMIGRNVDLIWLNHCDIIITMQVLANGKLLINNDPGQFLLYKARKISEYIDFKADRKVIEDSMLRGRIYA